MRYLFPVLILLLSASCKKQGEAYPFKATYVYRNNSGHPVQIELYRSGLADSSCSMVSGGTFTAEYTGTGSLPTPFFRQVPDSAIILFDSNKKIIYTLDGDNGFGKSRNVLNNRDKAYEELQQGPRISVYQYTFTADDYLNAR